MSALIKQINKKKHTDTEYSKPGNDSIEKRNTFKRFKQDLEQVVLKGKITGGLQYVLEIDNSASICAYYLLSIYSDYAGRHSQDGECMADNTEVMELWQKFSGEGLDKESTEEHLLMKYERA